MRIGLGISQEQTQKLMMTPELRLAIKILQLSTVELTDYIEEQLVENPVLEVAEEAADGDRGSGNEDKEPEAGKMEESTGDKTDIDWEQYFEDLGETMTGDPVRVNEGESRFDSLVAAVPTLQDHLALQLGMARLSGDEKEVGEFLIGNIDDNGYLCCSVDEAAIQCGVSFAVAEKVLGVIQGFDPMGVGARDLRECLLLQYEQMDCHDQLLLQVIQHHLAEIAEGKSMKVAKKLEVSLSELQRATDQLKHMEPKPGRKFSPSGGARYIVPDVIVEKVEGEYIVLVNDAAAPRLTVNPFYREVVKSGSPDKEGREYLEGKLTAAVWLMKSIEQRRLTLYKVARCIVEFQLGFFEHGVKQLKPLNLKQVAEALSVHESTVSRATTNKYMQTPRGLFEMKFFFTGGYADAEGVSVSSETVKKMIREMVEGEDARKPLSDQKITVLLQARGLDVSRRTVAKYRDEMGIPPTPKRRRY